MYERSKKNTDFMNHITINFTKHVQARFMNMKLEILKL
jgi:hypothetical protein